MRGVRVFFSKKQSVNAKVKELLSAHLDSFLGEHSFERKGTDYRRNVGDCIQHLFFRFDIDGEASGRCYYFANVEYPEIERLLEFGVPDAEAVNTIGKQMGYLGRNGNFEEWSVTARTSVEELARKFKDHIRSYGLPFLTKFCDKREVVRALENGEIFNLDKRDAAMKLAAFLFLLGEKQRAIDVLADQEKEIAGHPQQVRFIRFRNYLGSLA